MFQTYPVELVNNLKSRGANLDVATRPDGTFKVDFWSHFSELKQIMTAQRWKKNNSSKIWRVLPPPEPTIWEKKGQEYLAEVARRKTSKPSVLSIYDKLYDVTVHSNPTGTKSIVHNVFRTDEGKPWKWNCVEKFARWMDNRLDVRRKHL